MLGDPWCCDDTDEEYDEDAGEIDEVVDRAGETSAEREPSPDRGVWWVDLELA